MKIPELVSIPSGTFIIGDYHPDVITACDSFRIGKYVVTNEEWNEYLRDALLPEVEGNPRNPIVNVTYEDAKNYCLWLREKGVHGARLPTEVEWEYAARGTDGIKYPWGNEEPDHGLCNFANVILTDVDSHPAGVSPFGCYGMAGNVWEMTLSRTLRGGSFNDAKHIVRCVFRTYLIEYQEGSYHIGFRIAANE